MNADGATDGVIVLVGVPDGVGADEGVAEHVPAYTGADPV